MRIKLTFVEWLVIASIIGVLVMLLTPTLNSDHDARPRYPPLPAQPVSGVSTVAGDYYLGNGRGTNLNLSILPDGRYSFVAFGCTGVQQREAGFIEAGGEHYRLLPAGKAAEKIERNLVLIGWGPRRYLVPARKLEEFRAAVAEKREPRDSERGWFYVRLPLAPAEGSPDWPAD